MKVNVKVFKSVVSFPVKESQKIKQPAQSKICSKHLFNNQASKTNS